MQRASTCPQTIYLVAFFEIASKLLNEVAWGNTFHGRFAVAHALVLEEKSYSQKKMSVDRKKL